MVRCLKLKRYIWLLQNVEVGSAAYSDCDPNVLWTLLLSVQQQVTDSFLYLVSILRMAVTVHPLTQKQF